MAFTLSHAVLAPYLARLFTAPTPIASLAIGCMAPDLYRFFTTQNYLLPHQWQGIFSFTLWLGLGFCLLWYLVYRPVLYSLLGISDPILFNKTKDYIKFILKIIVGLILGITTHLLWDGLTHVDFRTLILHDVLSQQFNVFGQVYPLHRILQIGSSALTMPWLIWLLYEYFYQHKFKPINYLNLYCCAVVCLVGGCLKLMLYLHHLSEATRALGLYYLTGSCINHFFQGLLLSLFLFCIVFLLMGQRHQTTSK